MIVTIDVSRNGKSYERFISNVAKTLDEVHTSATEWINHAADYIHDESLAQVPRDTGTLASAIYREVETEYGTHYMAHVGYGDRYNAKHAASTLDYMFIVHEDLTLNHPNGGKAKFLEDPARDYFDNVLEGDLNKYIGSMEKVLLSE